MSHPLSFNDENFHSEVLDSEQPVLVDFWAGWCGPCRAVGPTIEELAGQYQGRVKVGQLNVDENPRATRNFNVQSIPAVLLFRNGQVVDTLIGIQPKERYEQAIRRMVAA